MRFFFICFFLFNFIENNYIYFFNNHDSSTINNFNLIKENYLNIIKFFNFPNNIINLLIISYLFLLIIIVVKITNFFKGPIRSIN